MIPKVVLSLSLFALSLQVASGSTPMIPVAGCDPCICGLGGGLPPPPECPPRPR